MYISYFVISNVLMLAYLLNMGNMFIQELIKKNK